MNLRPPGPQPGSACPGALTSQLDVLATAATGPRSRAHGRANVVRVVSIKGRPQKWLEQAVATGNLPLALGEAAQLRPLPLGSALGLVCLLPKPTTLGPPGRPRAGPRA